MGELKGITVVKCDILDEDRSFLVSDLEKTWPLFAGKTLFVTGGTGFVGKNLLKSVQTLNTEYPEKPLYVKVLSRNPSLFLEQFPGFGSDNNISFVTGDVRTFQYSDFHADFVLHGATDVGDVAKAANHQDILSVNYEGTKHVVEAARSWRSERLMLLSSGAVYGTQDPKLSNVEEKQNTAPDTSAAASSYGEGKRLSEWIVQDYGRTSGTVVTVGRLFAFLGPWLPLEGPFAAGNFVKDCLLRREIVIRGDGTPLRSYLYSTELISWVLQILARASSGSCYNVGSSIPTSIRELAEETSRIWATGRPVTVLTKPEVGRLSPRYVPSVEKLRIDLGLSQKIPLGEALRRHRRWLQGVEND